MRALHALILGAWILGASGCTAKPCPECPPCPQPHPQEAASAASARITPGSTSGAPSESAAAAAAENNPEERTPEKCRLYHLVSEYETVIFDHRSHEGYA
ncbi:MAG: hypothetical protein FJ098_16675, partial [Deltaproteobacteria bacterium]|nr:hypothetical protein [Deltaproteobacteria bacterium]